MESTRLGLRAQRTGDDVSDDEEAREPIRDFVDAPGLTAVQRLGRRIWDKDLAFISDDTLTEGLQPSTLNGGNIVDIFQRREDDYEAPTTLEVEYLSEGGEKVHEIVFVDPVSPGLSGPRILVTASRVNTMNRAISVLSRKVDNLTTTLRVCRSDYYKELFSLRHGREPLEEHEKYWFMPQAYQDMVSIKELRKRFGTEQQELRKKDQEVKELRAKLHQIDNLVEDRMEQLVQSKPLSELFRWLKRLNDFREAEWEEYIVLLSKAIADKFAEAMGEEGSNGLSEGAPGQIDMEKVHLRSRVETAEMEVDTLRAKLQAAEMNQQSFAKLLTERKVDIPDHLRSSSRHSTHSNGQDAYDAPVRERTETDDIKRVVSYEREMPAALNEAPVLMEPPRQRKLSMYKPHREEERTKSIASTEEGQIDDVGSSISASLISRQRWSSSMPPEKLDNTGSEALAKEQDPFILKAKIRELETLAGAWEQEARDQSTKCLELEGRNKEAGRVQRQRDLAMKDLARSQKRTEALEHELAELQAANAELRARMDAEVSGSEDGSRRHSAATARRASVDEDRQGKLDKLRNEGGRLGLPGETKVRRNVTAASPEQLSPSRGKASASPSRRGSAEKASASPSRRGSTAEKASASPSRRGSTAVQEKPTSSRRGSAASRSPGPPRERDPAEAPMQAKPPRHRGSTSLKESKEESSRSADDAEEPSKTASSQSAEEGSLPAWTPSTLKKDLLEELVNHGPLHAPGASPRSIEDAQRSSSSNTFREAAANFFSMYSDDMAKWTLTEGSTHSREMQDASTQTLITVGGAPPGWQVWQGPLGASDEKQEAQMQAVAKCKLLQWCMQFIRSEEPDILKLASAMAVLDKRIADIRRCDPSKETAPSPPTGKKGDSAWSKAVQRMNRLRNEKMNQSSAYEEERQRSALAQPAPEPLKTPKLNPGPPKLVAVRRAADAVKQTRKWISSPSGAAFCRAEPMPEPQPLSEESQHEPTLEVPSTCNSLVVESRSPSKGVEQMQGEDEQDGGDTFEDNLQVALKHAVDGNGPGFSKKQIIQIPEAALSWPRQTSTRSDAETLESQPKEQEGSEYTPSPSASARSREGVQRPQELQASPSRVSLPSLSTREFQVVGFRHEQVGSGLYEQPQPRPFSSSQVRGEPWLPEVARGGFTGLDTPSMIAGQLERFATDQKDYLEELIDEREDGEDGNPE